MKKHCDKDNVMDNQNIYCDIKKKIYLKYIIIPYANKNTSYWNIKKINDLLINRPSHLLAKYKDNLIEQENGEYLNSYYPLHDSLYKIIELCDYYKSYCVIYPNYALLPESRYISDNIQKKQKLIDYIQYKEALKYKKIINIQEHEQQQTQKKEDNNTKVKKNDIFDSNIHHELWDLTVNNSEILKLMGIKIITKHVNNKKDVSIERIIKLIERSEIQKDDNNSKANINFRPITQFKKCAANLITSNKTELNKNLHHKRLKTNLGFNIRTNCLFNALSFSKKRNVNTTINFTLNNGSNIKTTNTSTKNNNTTSSASANKYKKMKTPMKRSIALLKLSGNHMQFKPYSGKRFSYIQQMSPKTTIISRNFKEENANSSFKKVNKVKRLNRNKEKESTTIQRSHEVKSLNEKNSKAKMFLNSVIIKGVIKQKLNQSQNQKSKEKKNMVDEGNFSEKIKKKHNSVFIKN